jgi:selenocysteine lyase/cysteine desulfurase
MPDLAALRAEFALAPELLYFNHAAVAPWPKRAADAACRFAQESATTGALHYPRWLETETRLRQRLARLINAAPDDVALLKNTSEGLSTVAFGLDWRPGDSVVGIAMDFPSNRVVWEALREFGVCFRGVDVNAATDPEAALLAACDGSTRLLAVSWVHYVSGLTLDLARLGRACRERGILFCVDAIQGLGALPLDVRACQIDFAAADGHKWLLGPEGIAVFYCRPEARERLRLRQVGWHSLAHPGDYDRADWSLAPSARRFECGSPNLLGIHALEASLSLLEDAGPDAIAARIGGHTRRLRAALARLPGVTVLGPEDERRWSGIVSFRSAGTESRDLCARLADAGLICAARGGAVRLSPHFYIDDRKLEFCIEKVSGFISGRGAGG